MYVVRRSVAISCKKYYHISQLSSPAGAGHGATQRLAATATNKDKKEKMR